MVGHGTAGAHPARFRGLLLLLDLVIGAGLLAWNLDGQSGRLAKEDRDAITGGPG